jgi:hypothetical protein
MVSISSVLGVAVLSLIFSILSLAFGGTGFVTLMWHFSARALDGQHCWDRNSDGKCTLPDEDVTKDGKCDWRDCISFCWDKNGDGLCQLDQEDINNDGVCNTTDCRSFPGTLIDSDISPLAKIAIAKLKALHPNEVVVSNENGTLTTTLNLAVTSVTASEIKTPLIDNAAGDILIQTTQDGSNIRLEADGTAGTEKVLIKAADTDIASFKLLSGLPVVSVAAGGALQTDFIISNTITGPVTLSSNLDANSKIINNAADVVTPLIEYTGGDMTIRTNSNSANLILQAKGTGGSEAIQFKLGTVLFGEFARFLGAPSLSVGETIGDGGILIAPFVVTDTIDTLSPGDLTIQNFNSDKKIGIEASGTGGSEEIFFKIGSNTLLSILASAIKASADLVPSADGTYSLGTNSLRWKNLFLSGNLSLVDLTANDVISPLFEYTGGDMTVRTNTNSAKLILQAAGTAGNEQIQFKLGSTLIGTFFKFLGSPALSFGNTPADGGIIFVPFIFTDTIKAFSGGSLLIANTVDNQTVIVQAAGTGGSEEVDIKIGTTTKLAVSASSVKATADVVPSSDATYSLGTNALRWKNLFISGNVTLTELIAADVVTPLVEYTGGDMTVRANTNSAKIILQSAGTAGNEQIQFKLGSSLIGTFFKFLGSPALSFGTTTADGGTIFVPFVFTDTIKSLDAVDLTMTNLNDGKKIIIQATGTVGNETVEIKTVGSTIATFGLRFGLPAVTIASGGALFADFLISSDVVSSITLSSDLDVNSKIIENAAEVQSPLVDYTGGDLSVVANSNNAKVILRAAGTGGSEEVDVKIGTTTRLAISASSIKATADTVPSSDATYSLGTTLLRWKDLFLSGSMNVTTITANDVKSPLFEYTGGDMTIRTNTNSAKIILQSAGTAGNEQIQFKLGSTLVATFFYFLGSPSLSIGNATTAGGIIFVPFVFADTIKTLNGGDLTLQSTSDNQKVIILASGTGGSEEVDVKIGSTTKLAVTASSISATADTVPSSDATYSLGTNLLRWKNLFISGNVTLAELIADVIETPLIEYTGGNMTIRTNSNSAHLILQAKGTGGSETIQFKVGTAIFGEFARFLGAPSLSVGETVGDGGILIAPFVVTDNIQTLSAGDLTIQNFNINQKIIIQPSGTGGSEEVDIKIGSTIRLAVTASSVKAAADTNPMSDATYSLGTALLRWKDLFLSGSMTVTTITASDVRSPLFEYTGGDMTIRTNTNSAKLILQSAGTAGNEQIQFKLGSTLVATFFYFLASPSLSIGNTTTAGGTIFVPFVFADTIKTLNGGDLTLQNTNDNQKVIIQASGTGGSEEVDIKIGSTTKLAITSVVAASANTVPSADATYSLGTALLRWTNIFLSGSIQASGLSPNQTVVTDSSRNFVSLPYTSAATVSTIMSRDSSANTAVNVLTATDLISPLLEYTGGNMTIRTNTNNSHIRILAAGIGGLESIEFYLGSTMVGQFAYFLGEASLSVGDLTHGGLLIATDIGANNILTIGTGDLTVKNFNSNQKIIVDAAGSGGSEEIDLRISSVTKLAVILNAVKSSADLVPGSDNSYSLGTASLGWASIATKGTVSANAIAKPAGTLSIGAAKMVSSFDLNGNIITDSVADLTAQVSATGQDIILSTVADTHAEFVRFQVGGTERARIGYISAGLGYGLQMENSAAISANTISASTILNAGGTLSIGAAKVTADFDLNNHLLTSNLGPVQITSVGGQNVIITAGADTDKIQFYLGATKVGEWSVPFLPTLDLGASGALSALFVAAGTTSTDTIQSKSSSTVTMNSLLDTGGNRISNALLDSSGSWYNPSSGAQHFVTPDATGWATFFTFGPLTGSHTYNFPDLTGTVALASGAQTFTDKALDDATTTIKDTGTSGAIAFAAPTTNAVTTTITAAGQTASHTYTIPNVASDTFALIGASQTYTTPTLTKPAITIIQHSDTVSITDNVASTVLTATLASGTAIGGSFEYTLYATGADFQAASGLVHFAAVNKAGVITTTITQQGTRVDALSGSSTLGASAWTMTAANPALIKIQADTSISPSTMTLVYTLKYHSSQAIS